jgi:pilus assembly protein Flp/PilA
MFINQSMRVFQMHKLVTRFATNEEGAALVEYGMLVGLIAVVCIGAVTALGLRIQDVFNTIDADLAPLV